MRYITLAIAFLICTASDAQIIRAEPFYTAPVAAVSGNLLLDDYPGAGVAYSLRKLDKDYTGSAIRVRRSSDNTEQDIGFVNNYLDTASMKTFVGANNGFVVTWYNQADSSGVFGVLNATQATAANQPQIISSGQLIYTDGEVSLSFDGINDFVATYRRIITNDFSVYGVMKSPSDNTNSFFATQYNVVDSTRTIFYGENNTGRLIAVQIGSTVISNGTPLYSQKLLYYNRLGINVEIADNNSSLTTGTLSNICQNAPLRIAVFRAGAIFEYSKINAHELIIYATDNSGNRVAISSNINSFYSIY